METKNLQYGLHMPIPWLAAMVVTCALALGGCIPEPTDGVDGRNGVDGVAGTDGVDGSDGSDGAPGLPGTPGTDGLGIKVTDRHGLAKSPLATRGPNNPSNPVTTITGASVNGDGKLVVNLEVKTASGASLPGLTGSMMTLRVAQLRPGDAYGDPDYWVSYSNALATRSTVARVADDPDAQPAGTKINQPGGESTATGTWVDHGNGSYTYTSAMVLTNGITIQAPVFPAGYTGITSFKSGTFAYDAALPHRVAFQLADPDGTGPATMGANNPVYDFIPATGAAIDDPREVVVVENCNQCHTTLGFHGGGRLDTKLCVMCHNPTAGDPESGNTIDLKVMVHKIHMGKHLPSVGFDFINAFAGRYDEDHSAAVKGKPYAIWGHNQNKYDFSEIGFPANAATCVKCHDNAAHGDNWKNRPSQEACGSCHDGIDFAAGTGTRVGYPDAKVANPANAGDLDSHLADRRYWVNDDPGTGTWLPVTTGHGGNAQASNMMCAGCHTDSAVQGSGINNNLGIAAAHDVTAKARPDVLIEMSMVNLPARGYYLAGETPVVRVVLKDPTSGLAIDHSTVTAANYATRNFYVNGPRANRIPALTAAAVATKTSTGTTTANTLDTTNAKVTLGAGDAWLDYELETVSSEAPGTYSAFVNIKSTEGTATAALRRNRMGHGLLNFQVKQLAEEPQVALCTSCHEDTVWHDNTKNGINGNHPAPFNPDACGSCHDYFAPPIATAGIATNGRFSDGTLTYWRSGGVCQITGTTSVDYNLVTPGECRGYQDEFGEWVGRTWVASYCQVGSGVNFSANSAALCSDAGGTWWAAASNQGFGTTPIARRVHGVHFGSRSTRVAGSIPYVFEPGVSKWWEIYPNHNVAITFTQDVRNCETCHGAETSGTWATKPNRVACLACHDSEAAFAHAKLMTDIPDPSRPFVGDETETCTVCH